MIGIRNTLDDTDILMTGRAEIIYDNLQYRYRVSLCGKTCYFDTGGLIVNCPEDSSLVNTQLMLVKVVLDQTTTNVITRSSGGTEVNKTISSANPRDEFAMEVLNAIIQKQENPQGFDDGSMLRTAQQAYRWANAMMEAAADNRYDDTQAPTQGGSTGDVANAINAKGTASTPLVVKGNTTYTPSGGTAIPDVLNVNVVAGGGGGGGGSVNLDTLIAALGYNASATPAVTQESKMDELIDAVTNSSQLKKANVAEFTGATSTIDYFLIYSDNNNVHPYKLPRTTFDRMYGLLPSSQTTFPLAPEHGYYYRVSTALGSSLTINLGSYTFLVGAVRIFIARFTVGSSACALSFTVNGDTPAAGAVKWRGTKLTSLDADTEYEMDFVANGSCWTVGATKIVS